MADNNPAFSADDVAAVQAVPQRIVAAWAKHDAEAFADVFRKDGLLILPGGVFVTGRDEIRDFMAAGYSGPYKGTQVYGEPVTVRALGPGACVLITRGGVLAPGETEVAPERAVHAMWVVVKEGEDWLLAAYQNTPIAKA